ncbi:hypothetical protein DQG13_01595 [Paenibacillus sp. YN15]|nr:hypothetical protein DQG13_01595 [Paenibacillus sp. YN15]
MPEGDKPHIHLYAKSRTFGCKSRVLLFCENAVYSALFIRGLPQKYPDFASELAVTFGGLF